MASCPLCFAAVRTVIAASFDVHMGRQKDYIGIFEKYPFLCLAQTTPYDPKRCEPWWKIPQGFRVNRSVVFFISTVVVHSLLTLFSSQLLFRCFFFFLLFFLRGATHVMSYGNLTEICQQVLLINTTARPTQMCEVLFQAQTAPFKRHARICIGSDTRVTTSPHWRTSEDVDWFWQLGHGSSARKAGEDRHWFWQPRQATLAPPDTKGGQYVVHLHVDLRETDKRLAPRGRLMTHAWNARASRAEQNTDVLCTVCKKQLSQVLWRQHHLEVCNPSPDFAEQLSIYFGHSMPRPFCCCTIATTLLNPEKMVGRQ